jgi:ABC-2 type transport system ATP-binding protein
VTLNAIHAEGLRKQFGDTVAVDRVDLTVAEGTVYGFLGPNGAGKTTTIRMLATLIRPTSGRARIFGHDVVADADVVRTYVSLTGQYASIDEDLTGMETLQLMGRLHGYRHRPAADRASDLLTAFSLDDAADRRVRSYSGGMRRRLDIAASIVTTPALLVLDEPTTGLDPRSRNQVWDVVRALTATGTTVLLTTQYLEEADRLADRLAVIDRGRTIAEGTTAELKRSVGAATLRVQLRDPAQKDSAAQIMTSALSVPIRYEPDLAALSARIDDSGRASAVLRELVHAGIEVSDFGVGQVSLDEVFLTLTGHHSTSASLEQVRA